MKFKIGDRVFIPGYTTGMILEAEYYQHGVRYRIDDDWYNEDYLMTHKEQDLSSKDVPDEAMKFKIGDKVLVRMYSSQEQKNFKTGVVIDIRQSDTFCYRVNVNDGCGHGDIGWYPPEMVFKYREEDMSNRELVRIKTDDGAEIEAEVVKKTEPKPSSDKTPNKVRDFEVGDHVVTERGSFAKIIKINSKNIDLPYCLNKYDLDSYGWFSKQDIRHATRDKIDIRLKYTNEELKLRDQFAQSMLCNDKIWHQFRANETVTEAIYRIAEEMLEARKKVRSNEE